MPKHIATRPAYSRSPAVLNQSSFDQSFRAPADQTTGACSHHVAVYVCNPPHSYGVPRHGFSAEYTMISYLVYAHLQIRQTDVRRSHLEFSLLLSHGA